MIVVTGGAGFIGSNILKGLNDAGENNVLVVDNLSNAQKHLNLNRLSFNDYIDKDDFLLNIGKFKNYLSSGCMLINHRTGWEVHDVK